jgi:DNA ligase-associated metallophosphoesterase
MVITLQEREFVLLPQKAVYKPDEELLIIADVHLGKARHFLKGGINIPSSAQQQDYQNLTQLFITYQPRKVYFLGDLFHSSINTEWMRFESLIQAFNDIEFTLIKGNHDIIDARLYVRLDIRVATDYLEDDHFIYSHYPFETPVDKIVFSGHIHPSFRLYGKARQSVLLPCYHWSTYNFMLPSFGGLTGSFAIKPVAGDRVFVVYADTVKEIVP